MMIGMNALIDLEYAAGTLSVECTDEQSMYSLLSNCSENDEACMYKLVFERALHIYCTNCVHVKYIKCTYIVYTKHS
jgi:hypothetical protein